MMHRNQLLAMFSERVKSVVVDSNGNLHTGVIGTLQHEDGSGNSFNVTFEDGRRVYVKTFENFRPKI